MKLTIKGKKKITIRRYRPGAHSLKKEEIFVGNFEDGLDILLQATADTEVKLFKDLTKQELEEDGFSSIRDAFDKLKKHYSDLVETDNMAIVRYKIVEMQGVAVVKLNAYQHKIV